MDSTACRALAASGLQWGRPRAHSCSSGNVLFMTRLRRMSLDPSGFTVVRSGSSFPLCRLSRGSGPSSQMGVLLQSVWVCQAGESVILRLPRGSLESTGLVPFQTPLRQYCSFVGQCSLLHVPLFRDTVLPLSLRQMRRPPVLFSILFP